MFALRAFSECGLISVKNEEIKLTQVTSKVDLMNTKTMKALKRRLDIE